MIANLMIGAIRLYQRFISPILPPACRFTPSCSHYTAQAIQLWGPLRGGWMGAMRICRCQPLFAGGHDPVPLPPGHTFVGFSGEEA